MKKLQKSDELKRAVEILNSYSLNSKGSVSLRTETSLVMTLWSYPSCFIKRQRLGLFPCVFSRKVTLSYHKIFKFCYLILFCSTQHHPNIVRNYLYIIIGIIFTHRPHVSHLPLLDRVLREDGVDIVRPCHHLNI